MGACQNRHFKALPRKNSRCSGTEFHSDLQKHHFDSVLQSTIMWLFVSIACLMCIGKNSDASPELSLNIVSPDFSPFFFYLGTQATYAATVWAGPMVSVCRSSPGFGIRVLLELLSPCAYIHGDLWQTFMEEFSPSQQVGSPQPSGLELCCPCCPALHKS